MDQFILVNDPNDNEPIEIPMTEDGTVSFNTLEHAFPRAYGLKYKNPATGAKRVVQLDESGKNFLAPPGGWESKVFELIFRSPTATDDSAKGTNDPKSEQTPIKRKQDFEGDVDKDDFDLSGGTTWKTGEKDGTDGRSGGKKPKREEADEHERKQNGGASEGCVDLIVMGVPYDLDDNAMRDYFEQFGPVAYYEIKRKSNGQSRGFGFVRMNNYRDQVQVLSKAHHCIGGRECQVRISSSEKGVETHLSKMVESRANPRLFIGGLNDEISRDRLREFFNDHVRRFDKFAQVQDMYCPKPFRNFAFMTVGSQGAAKELVRQRDFLVDGQMCHVTVAVPKRGEEMQQMPRQQPPQQQPWANNQSQQYKASPGQYAGYGPPPVEMFPSEQRWNAGDGGGGRGYGGPPQFEDDYPTRGGGAQHGRSMAAYEPTYPPVDYPPQNRVRQAAYDPREDVNLDTYQPITQSQGRADIWMRGNEPNIPSAQAEAILNQLPNDAVGTALKMLQSIMANNGKRGDYENGQNGGGGDGRQSPGTRM